MSDETVKTAAGRGAGSVERLEGEKLEAYEPRARGAARVEGVEVGLLDARLGECGEYFTKHCDEADYRNLEWYLWRMQLRYALGDDVFCVMDDAFLAARCLHDRHAMHLELKPPEMFMTRRIVPVELGIISGMPMLTLEFSATYGLPLMMVLGQTAPEDVMSEANLMTSYFRRGFCADFVELTGLSAVIYAGVIAAIGRGFDDEAALGLNTYAKARDSLRGMPPAALLGKIRRYDALNTALACLCAGQFGKIGEILAPEAEAFAQAEARRFGDGYYRPEKMPVAKYFDLSILTILALGILRGAVIELPETGVIAGYRVFLEGLTQMPDRRVEAPELDDEARRILQEAGVDPDHLGGDYVDHSFHDAKEESESRAAALFEERQRRAQEAVREKLQQEDRESGEPALADGQDSGRRDEESGEKQDYSTFFDNLDARVTAEFDDGSGNGKWEDEAPKARTFTAEFFSQEQPLHGGLKMTLDEPESAAEKKSEAPKQEENKPEYISSIEDNSPRINFAALFDDTNRGPLPDLRMSDDVEEDARVKAVASQCAGGVGVEEGASVCQAGTGGGKDFRQFFDASLREEALVGREAQLLELEAAQAERMRREAQGRAPLKLSLDGTEDAVSVCESYQQRLERLQAEKHAAARDQALREREASRRELELLEAQGPKKIEIERLQLVPDESDDPDERVEKVDPEDLVIKGSAYSFIDMVKSNTREREDVEEDFDLYAAMRASACGSEGGGNSGKDIQSGGHLDDDMHITIDYDALAKREDS